jgi:trehalose 6-phosphate synthase
VTLPRPDLPRVLLSHRGPVSFGRDESGRTASRGAGGLVTALIGADGGPPRRCLSMRAATDEDPAVVGEHDHQVFSATLEPEPRLLDQAEPASQERQVPTVRLRVVEVDRQGPGPLCRGPSRAAGTRAPHGDGTESPP